MNPGKIAVLAALAYLAGAVAPALAQFCCTLRTSGGASICTDGIEDIERCIAHGENPGIGSCATRCVSIPFCCADPFGTNGFCYDGPPIACRNLGGTPGLLCQSDGTCAVPLIE